MKKSSALPYLVIVLLATFLLFALIVRKNLMNKSSSLNQVALQWSHIKQLPSCDQQIRHIEVARNASTPSGKILVISQTGQIAASLFIKNKILQTQVTNPTLQPQLNQLEQDLQASGSAYSLAAMCEENNRPIMKQIQLSTDPSKADYVSLVITKLDAILQNTPYHIRWTSNQ